VADEGAQRSKLSASPIRKRPDPADIEAEATAKMLAASATSVSSTASSNDVDDLKVLRRQRRGNDAAGAASDSLSNHVAADSAGGHKEFSFARNPADSFLARQSSLRSSPITPREDLADDVFESDSRAEQQSAYRPMSFSSFHRGNSSLNAGEAAPAVAPLGNVTAKVLARRQQQQSLLPAEPVDPPAEQAVAPAAQPSNRYRVNLPASAAPTISVDSSDPALLNPSHSFHHRPQGGPVPYRFGAPEPPPESPPPPAPPLSMSGGSVDGFAAGRFSLNPPPQKQLSAQYWGRGGEEPPSDRAGRYSDFRGLGRAAVAESFAVNRSEEAAAPRESFGSRIRADLEGGGVKDMAIRVVVRKRPLSRQESAKGDRDVLDIEEGGQVFVNEPKIKVQSGMFSGRYYPYSLL
jgi:hypothetical protein